MAHVKENDVMIDFYLSPSLLQREILDQYQELAGSGKKRESLLDFLEERFITEISSKKANASLHRQKGA